MRGFRVRHLAFVVVIAAAAALMTASMAHAAFRGLGLAKSCNATTPVFAAYTCNYKITNNLDENTPQDTYVVTAANFSDTVLAKDGNVGSPTSPEYFSEIAWVAINGATCSGGTGSGTALDPYIGATSCTLPGAADPDLGPYARITSVPNSFYNVQPDDYTLAGHQLFDTVAVTGNDTTSNTTVSASTQGFTTVTLNPSSTVTSIEGGSTQAAGSSVSDDVTVNGVLGDPPPDGTVTVSFFGSSTCDPATQVGSSSTVTLNGSGQANGVLPEGPLAAGLYGYKAVYNGSNAYTGSTGDCEPLRIVDANIQISPNGVNRVGQTHTFTGHVNVNDGTGSASAQDGTLITFSIDSGPGSFVGGVNSCTTSGGTGSCQVSITSAVTGVTTVSAHTTLDVAGVGLMRNTDGTGGNSGPATKTWVNAAISITPSATNRVGQPHTFTVTLTKDTGTGTFVPAAGEHVDVTLTNGNGASHTAPTGTCTNAGPNTDSNGQCTITFTSPTTGTVTGHASSTLSVAGSAPFTVQTDGTGLNSGDATKTFVDAEIAIAPNATNEVGQPHTFTVTLMKDSGDGSGFQPAAGEHVDVTLTNSNGAAHTAPTGSCTTAGPNTDSAGQCTITFTSPTAGKVTGHASSTLSVGGVPIMVQTDGTGNNSGDAVKTFVDANISITPNGTNQVGHTHTFTATVLVNDGSGGGFVPAQNGTPISFTIDSGPGSFTSANPCTTAGDTGSCQIGLTSNVVGTTIVSAHTTVSVGGVPVQRATDGTGSNSGPATKNWVDANIQITPATATNPIGTDHVLTITVNALGGTIDAGSHTATASIVSGPGSFDGPASCTYTGGAATASCTVTITSNVAGTTVVSATSDIPVSGVSITKTTGTADNTASGGSDNASKLWVAPDANIQLTPATAANQIGTNHTLHCHINVAMDGTNFSNAPDGTVCTVTIISGPGTPTTQDCTTSGGTGTCDVVITSSVVGTSTVQAKTTLVVNTVTLMRMTGDSNVGDGPNATKNWVDANIQITPSTATNAVGTNHVLTITVNALGGTIDAGSHTATASIVSGPGSFVGPASCTYTGGAATASCTVTISSAVVGTTVVQATSNIPVSGVSITKTTGTADNTASGGSGNASKNWVDANIQITPATANNPVGANHVLTITVNALGGTIDAGSHTATASIVSGPGSFVGPASCTYTGGAATASCTVTITSATAGTTVVSATSDIPVSGQTITRTTGTAANTASGGSGNASKNWADDQVTTKVLDASNSDVTNSTTITPGTVVHDEATVTKTAGTPAAVPAPTGTVTFTLYDNGTCNGNVLATSPNVALNGSGIADSATFTTPATSGSFSYLAHYNGDGNYPAKDAGCEPFQTSNPFAPALTPGFWKNHQAATSALLPITLGNYNVNTFDKAYAVFEAMKCSSPIDCLAGHLLAAKLDLKSGSNPSITPTITQADNLLKAVNYNGPGNFTATAAQKALALQLEVLIDKYTNQ